MQFSILQPETSLYSILNGKVFVMQHEGDRSSGSVIISNIKMYIKLKTTNGLSQNIINHRTKMAEYHDDKNQNKTETDTQVGIEYCIGPVSIYIYI